MMQTIKLSLVKSLIIESVKNETYLRGQVEKGADPKAATKAYHEQAGDEEYHERLLERALYSNLGELKTQLSEYLTSSGQSSADNISSEEDGDVITLTLLVSDRFNKGFTDPLAKLCSKYIEESMLADWWKPINKDQSSIYLGFVEKDLASIRRCFNKTAPIIPSYHYPTTLTINGSAISIGPDEEDTITYVISDNAIDDIECLSDDTGVVEVGRCSQGFTVKGKSYGHAVVTLFSRHNTELSRSIDVYVVDQS